MEKRILASDRFMRFLLKQHIFFDEVKIRLNKSLMILHAFEAFFNKMVRFFALSNGDNLYLFRITKLAR
jgi:hypothetical protein